MRHEKRETEEGDESKRESDSHKSSLFTEEGELQSKEIAKEYIKNLKQKHKRKSLFNSTRERFTKEEEGILEVMEKLENRHLPHL